METTNARYVPIPSDRFTAALEEIGRKVESAGGSYRWGGAGREKVFVLQVHGSIGAVQVYTTMIDPNAAISGQELLRVRKCGADAVRVVVGYRPVADGPFRPTEKSQRVLRTAPRDADDRVGAFLARLTEIIRDAYRRARAIRPCPDCGKAMAIRTVKATGRRFLGCTGYPACRHTAAA